MSRIELWHALILIAIFVLGAAFVEACIEHTDPAVRTEVGLRRIYGAGSEVACPYRGAGMLSCMVRRPDGVIVRVRCGGDGCREATR